MRAFSYEWPLDDDDDDWLSICKAHYAGRHFRLRGEDSGHTIRSTLANNFMSPRVIET